MWNGAWLPRVPFAYSGGTWTLTGALVVNGNLTVEGATTTISTLNLLIEDKIITINNGGTTAGAVGAGLEIEGDAGAVVGYIKTGAADNSIFTLKAPGNASILTLDLNATKTWTVGGALNVEADSIINQDCTTDSSVAHADLTLTKAGIVTTGTMALLATNTTAATVGVPVQYSPDIRLVGHAWETTGSTDDTHTWTIRNVPATGATSSSKLSFLQATDAGVLVEKAYIEKDGGFFFGSLAAIHCKFNSELYSLAGGYRTVDDDYYGSISWGYECHATTSQTQAFGNACTASHLQAFVSGKEASSNHEGAFVRGFGKFTNIGDAQTIVLTLRGTSTVATPAVEITADAAVATATNTFTLAAGDGYAFDIQVVGKEDASANVWSSQFTGSVVKNGAGAASVIVDNVTSANATAANNALIAGTWAVGAGVVIDATGNRLRITCTAEEDTVRWVATVKATKVNYA